MTLKRTIFLFSCFLFRKLAGYPVAFTVKALMHLDGNIKITTFG